MVRHIVMWSFRDGIADGEKQAHLARIKQELEALPSIIPGVVSLAVHIAPLPSSSRDAVLNSLFESEEALAAYQSHPAHVRASQFVRSVMENRVCMDYVE